MLNLNGKKTFGSKGDSDIFFLKINGNLSAKSKDKLNNSTIQSNTVCSTISNKDIGKTEFTPKMKYESAFVRKINENYDQISPSKKILKDDSGTWEKTARSTSIGTYNKNTYTEKNKALGDPDVTAKERCILQNFPFLNKDEVRQIIFDCENIKNEREINKKNSYDVKKCTKENKINLLRSNIFNDKSKTNFNVTTQSNLSFNNYNEETKKSQTCRSNSNIHKNKWISTLDWRNENTEILFRKEKENDEESKLIAKTPYQRKLVTLEAHSSISKKNRNISLDLERLNYKKDLDKEFQEEITKNYIEKLPNKNLPQLKKRIEMSSSLQRRDFYAENYKRDVVETSIKIYEIKNTDQLDTQDFEKIFKKNGIHIYGLKTKSNITGGNTNSSITFNIRETEKVQKKLELVKEELGIKGFNINQKHLKCGRSEVNTNEILMTNSNVRDNTPKKKNGTKNVVPLPNQKINRIENKTYSKLANGKRSLLNSSKK